MSKHQLFVIVGALLLFVLLYFAPKKQQAVKTKVLNQELTINQEIDNAVDMVKSGKSPMKGIFALRDIVKEHPENIKAQQHLAEFAIVSGQFEKAIDRFAIILKIDSTFAPAYNGLHKAYIAKKDFENADKALLKYKQIIALQ